MPRVGRRPPQTTDLTELWRADIEDHVIALAWSPDERWLAAASVSGPVHLLDGATGGVTAVLAGHDLGTTTLSWKADSTCLASAGQDGMVRLWAVPQGEEQAALQAGAGWVERVAWSPDGAVLASAAGRSLRLWDAGGRLLQRWPDQSSTIADLQWRPVSGKARTTAPLLASASYGCVALWEPMSAEPQDALEWKGSILAMAWSPDGRFIATGGQDATVHFWVLASGKDYQMWGYPTKVRELSWDPTGRYLATGGGPVVVVWDFSGRGPQGTKPLMLEAHQGFLSTLAFQHAGGFLASGGIDGRVVVWHPAKHKKPLAQGRLEREIAQLAWAPGDQHLAAGNASGTVVVYATGALRG